MQLFFVNVRLDFHLKRRIKTKNELTGPEDGEHELPKILTTSLVQEGLKNKSLNPSLDTNHCLNFIGPFLQNYKLVETSHKNRVGIVYRLMFVCTYICAFT